MMTTDELIDATLAAQRTPDTRYLAEELRRARASLRALRDHAKSCLPAVETIRCSAIINEANRGLGES